MIGVAVWLLIVLGQTLIDLIWKSRVPWFELYPLPVPFLRAVLIMAECLVIGVSEEMTMRGYLIPRLEQITRSTTFAAFFSAVAFALLHIYQGFHGVVFALIAGSVFAFAFCGIRRLWPVVVAHALLDFIIITHIGARLE